MNIQILEKESGYMLYEGKSTNKFYYWGEGLIELANNNFSEIKKFLILKFQLILAIKITMRI